MTCEKKKVLMVCLGNICRSPIAEAVFQEAIRKAGLEDKWDVDSAAIGSWHAGREPDHRALKVMSKYSLPYKNKARQIRREDFETFDYIFGMDEENIDELQNRQPDGSKAKILLLGDFNAEGERIIRDPYYDSGSEGFEACYQQCVRSCDGFLKKILLREGVIFN